MTNPITPATSARLRVLIKAAGEWPDLEPEDQSDGSFRCPLCDGEGNIDAEYVKDGRREYGNDSWFSIVGVQVYGFGDAMAAMEELLPLLIKHTPALLDQLAAQAAEIERLNKGFHESCIAREEAANSRAKKAEARVAELEAEVERKQKLILAAIETVRQIKPCGHDGDEESGQHDEGCELCAWEASMAQLAEAALDKQEGGR